MINSVGSKPVHTSPPPPRPGDSYAIQPGDTVDTILDSFGLTSLGARTEFFNLNPYALFVPLTPGTRVFLPAGAATGPATGPSAPGGSVETAWSQGYKRGIARQNVYNVQISRAVAEHPSVDPLVLKSLLAQESSFHPTVVNKYGYAGIAQFGREAAHEMGLKTGGSKGHTVDRANDERLDPDKAIPAAAGLLVAKGRDLERGLTTVKTHTRLHGFRDLGRPEGDDYWRFTTAAYNGGQGTVLWAMRYAYGSTPPAQVRWSDLVTGPGGGPKNSPLWRAIRRVGMNPATKFAEISEYARDVLRRARQ